MLSRKGCEAVSVCASKAKEYEELCRNAVSSRCYYVLEGEMTVKAGEDEVTAQAGDLVFILANTEYCFKGTFRAVIVNAPAFDPRSDFSEVVRK